jgi:hypothetical protein
LPLGGFGISRYELDKYLYNEAKIGCTIVQETVSDVEFYGKFTITTNLKTYYASIVLGALGKDQIRY